MMNEARLDGIDRRRQAFDGRIARKDVDEIIAALWEAWELIRISKLPYVLELEATRGDLTDVTKEADRLIDELKEARLQLDTAKKLLLQQADIAVLQAGQVDELTAQLEAKEKQQALQRRGYLYAVTWLKERVAKLEKLVEGDAAEIERLQDQITELHLQIEPVTCRENLRRGIGPSAKRARRTHCINGHPFDMNNTYVYPNGWRKCKECNRDSKRRQRSA